MDLSDGPLRVHSHLMSRDSVSASAQELLFKWRILFGGGEHWSLSKTLGLGVVILFGVVGDTSEAFGWLSHKAW